MATHSSSTFASVGSSNAPMIAHCKHYGKFLKHESNSMLKMHTDKYCKGLKFIPEVGQASISWERDAAECIQHISNLEGELDIEQLHDVEVETGFAISLSDEEINLDEAASEARLSEAGEEKLTQQQALN
ncbi:hypothetical protein Tco_1380347 [Tanacetum coccineum]